MREGVTQGAELCMGQTSYHNLYTMIFFSVIPVYPVGSENRTGVDSVRD